MLYHEKERKNEEYAIFVHIVYLLAKLCNVFNDVSIYFVDFLLHVRTLQYT